MNNKNVFSKILTVFLVAVILIASVNITSFAELVDVTDGTTGTIIINNLEGGVKVSVYQLPAEGDIYPETFVDKIEDNSAEAIAFYDSLVSAIRGGTYKLEAIATKTVGGTLTPGVADQSVTISNLPTGTYLILIENGYRVYNTLVVKLAPEYNKEEDRWQLETPVTVNAKSSEIAITKTVDDNNVSTTDTITYTIEADIPQFPVNSLSTNYAISDILSEGITLENSFTVYGLNGEQGTLLTEGTDYKRSFTRPTDNTTASTFSLIFDYSKINAYEKIRIVYTAKLNQDVSVKLKNNGGNINTAYLEYSNNPYDSASWGGLKQVEENVYTYGITVNKVIKGTETALAGAEFSLYDEDDKIIKFKESGSGDGIYYKADDNTSTSTIVVGTDSSNNKGNLELRGLDIGTYYLTETKAPDEYNKLDKKIKVEVTEDGIKTIKVENSKGFQLPTTDGMGTVIFTVVGIVLIGVGILLVIVIANKKSKQKTKR